MCQITYSRCTILTANEHLSRDYDVKKHAVDSKIV